MSIRSVVVSIAAILVGVSPVHAKTYEVGNCIPNLPQFPTIQSAVNSVPAYSQIYVCPGTYIEQIVISKPLTLRGVGVNNQDRPVIFFSGGVVDATSLQGVEFLTILLVQNVSPPGDVDLINLTVDGENEGVLCGFDTPAGPQANWAGIFYDSGTSGHVQASVVRNIANSGCGYGIWLQNGNPGNESISVSNVSIHDFDNTGIAAYSNQNPPSLTVTINNDAIHAGFGGTDPANARPFTVTGIDAANIAGAISHNVVTGTDTAIYDHDFFEQVAGISIGNNDIGNVNPAGGIGIRLREGSTAKSNRVSNAYYAFSLNGGAAANPGPLLFANTIKNATIAVEYNCTANVSLKSNTINDAQIAFDFAPANFTLTNAVNPLYNVDTISSGSCP